MMDFQGFEVLSFDCYGTLIDWEGGILPVLKHLVSSHSLTVSNADLLEIFAELESQLEQGEYIKYRDVLRQVVKKMGERLGFEPSDSEVNSLADSLKNWVPFSDTVVALQVLKKKYKLAVISNTDDDLFADTAKHLQVEFDWVITAQQVQSYKPSTRNFESAIQLMGISADKLLHVAQSIYHDIVPAKSLGLSTVWVNRRQNQAGFGATLPASGQPDLEVPDLKSLVSIMGI